MTKINLRLRRLYFAVIFAVFLITAAYTPRVFAAVTYYNSVHRETITKGLTYEKISRVTDAGLLDVYILRMDLANPYLSVKPIKSLTDFDLKEATTKIVNDNGAIAGVNGDFFGVAGSYSIPMGVEVADGQILSITEDSNISGYQNATFFIDKENNPFIDYIRTEVHFLNDGHEYLKVSNVNKIFDLTPPCIITAAAMSDTKQVDNRIPGIYKIVCYDEKIQYISGMGETVSIPKDGYVVAFNEIVAAEKLKYFKVGQKVEYYLRPTIDLDKIKSAITGGGKILTNGATANDGGLVVGGRNPRTAIGISRDMRTLILMVVDGRTHSIGASQNEMAALMTEAGAYEAMHLDGGGSSTMVVTKPGETKAEYVNTVSEGSQRRVINALGIFNNGPLGDIKTIVVTPVPHNAIKNSSVRIYAYGLDEYNHRIDIPPDEIEFSVESSNGSADGTSNGDFYSTPGANWFKPVSTGTMRLNVAYSGVLGSSDILVHEIAELIPVQSTLRLTSSDSASLKFNGRTADNQLSPVDSGIVTYEVQPTDLGYVKDGIFTAQRLGSGYIKCSVGNVSAYITIYANGFLKTLVDFENKPRVVAKVYPEGPVSASAFYSESGGNAVSLAYSFKASSETQAAYLVFEQRPVIEQTAHSIRLSVFGDNSRHWLRGRIFDSTNKEYIIDFTKEINWDSKWETVEAVLPAGVVFPAYLDTIYVVSLSESTESRHSIYFTGLKYLSETQPSAGNSAGAIKTPENTKFIDNLSYAPGDEPSGGFCISFMPSVYYAGIINPANYESARKTAISALLKDSLKPVYMTNEDLTREAGRPIKYNSGMFNAELVNNTLIIALNSKNGGFMKSNLSQWALLKRQVDSSSAKNIIIYTDISPLSFSQPKEAGLFHEMLLELRQKGCTVFVVSNEGLTSSVTIKDGIRYINAGKLFRSDGSINVNFTIIKFKINNDGIKYTRLPIR